METYNDKELNDTTRKQQGFNIAWTIYGIVLISFRLSMVVI